MYTLTGVRGTDKGGDPQPLEVETLGQSGRSGSDHSLVLVDPLEYRRAPDLDFEPKRP